MFNDVATEDDELEAASLELPCEGAELLIAVAAIFQYGEPLAFRQRTVEMRTQLVVVHRVPIVAHGHPFNLGGQAPHSERTIALRHFNFVPWACPFRVHSLSFKGHGCVEIGRAPSKQCPWRDPSS